MGSITVLIYKSVWTIQNESHVKQFEDESTIKGTVATVRVYFKIRAVSGTAEE